MPESPLRILMLAPTPYFADRGCHVRIYEEARSLMAQGHEVRILTYHLGRDMPGIPTIRIPRIPWYSKLEAGPSWHKLYLDLLLFLRASLLIPEFRPDIIHAHLHEGAFIACFLKKISGIPMLFDYQGSLTGECIDHGFFAPDSRTATLFRKIELLVNGWADRIVTSSSAGASDLITTWGIDPITVSPLIDGVDVETFTPHPKGEARQALGLPLDTPVVAYLGLMNRYQGTDLLLDCIEHLKNDGVGAQFLVMGFPEERYRTDAHRRGLAGMLRFTGKVDYKDAPLLLSAADIAVTPKLSRTEANGKIYNYMACGLPVVAFDTPVNREALGDTGVYATYGDARDLADRIASLLADEAAREALSSRVRALAISGHSWQARGRQLAGIYRDMLGRT